MPITYVTGGIRSGKSEFAEGLAASEEGPVLYVAFGVETDRDMQDRIERHQNRRPGHWGLIEHLNELPDLQSVDHGYKGILVDCLSTWLANRCIQIPEEALKNKIYEEEILSEVSEWLKHVKQVHQHVIIVSSEVGLGGVALYRLGRFYQDILGKMNQLTAHASDEAYAVLSGLPLRLKR
jgi:adenosylcobinamide kinase/adenosylcobinamide-phosphate guanylyltransferase